MKRQIYFRTSPAEEWRLYTEIISTHDDAQEMVEFLRSFNHGYEFRLEEES